MSGEQPSDWEGDEGGCGYSWDHRTVEETRDGITVWTCTECGAEGFEDEQDPS